MPHANKDGLEVSVCIANWNCREMLRKCLGSLRQQALDVRLEVIVVDNASSDGADAMMASEFPEIILVRNPANLGFARANNQAARLARGRYLFFLNNDTEVPPHALRRLLDFAYAHPNAGIIGPRLRDGQGKTQVSYRLRPTVGTLLHRTSLLRWTGLFRHAYRRYRRQEFDPNTTRPVEMLMGAAMLIPRSVFERCGGWDEDFIFGGEDLDLSARIGKEATLLYHPEVEIIHYGRVSTRQHIGYATSNMMIGFLRYLRKSGYSRLALLGYKVVVTLDAPVQCVIKMMQYVGRSLVGKHKQAQKSWLALRGVGTFLTHGLVPFWRT